MAAGLGESRVNNLLSSKSVGSQGTRKNKISIPTLAKNGRTRRGSKTPVRSAVCSSFLAADEVSGADGHQDGIDPLIAQNTVEHGA